MSFQGKTAVVTGAGGGMGLAVAKELLAAGANVTLIDLKAPPEDPDTRTDAARYCRGDLTDDDFVRETLAESHERTGRLDYLVNGAGVLWFERDRSVLDIDLDDWNEIVAINLRSVVHTTRHAVPFMRQTGGGALVHVSSTQALRGDDNPQDAYQAAKAGIIALSKSFAIQFCRDGIRSNVLVPGPTQSPMQDRWHADPGLKRRTEEHIPLGRVGTPEDMAGAVLFLLSDRASYITGTELIVDGGLTAMP